MKKIFCFTIMWLLVVYAFAQIEGNVFDQKEKGIANAIIAAIDSSGKIVTTDTSDSRGFYSLKRLKSGRYKIEAKAAGFPATIKKNVEVPKETETSNDGYDTYFAIRVDIILVKAKTP